MPGTTCWACAGGLAALACRDHVSDLSHALRDVTLGSRRKDRPEGDVGPVTATAAMERSSKEKHSVEHERVLRQQMQARVKASVIAAAAGARKKERAITSPEAVVPTAAARVQAVDGLGDEQLTPQKAPSRNVECSSPSESTADESALAAEALDESVDSGFASLQDGSSHAGISPRKDEEEPRGLVDAGALSLDAFPTDEAPQAQLDDTLSADASKSSEPWREDAYKDVLKPSRQRSSSSTRSGPERTDGQAEPTDGQDACTGEALNADKSAKPWREDAYRNILKPSPREPLPSAKAGLDRTHDPDESAGDQVLWRSGIKPCPPPNPSGSRGKGGGKGKKAGNPRARMYQRAVQGHEGFVRTRILALEAGGSLGTAAHSGTQPATTMGLLVPAAQTRPPVSQVPCEFFDLATQDEADPQLAAADDTELTMQTINSRPCAFYRIATDAGFDIAEDDTH